MWWVLKNNQQLDKFGTCGSRKSNAVISVSDIWWTGAVQILT